VENTPPSMSEIALAMAMEEDAPLEVMAWAEQDKARTNAGMRMLKLLRSVGAPEGREAEALASFIYMYRRMKKEIHLYERGWDGKDKRGHAVLNRINHTKMPKESTEGLKVVVMSTMCGAVHGGTYKWLQHTLSEITRFNSALTEIRAGRMSAYEVFANPERFDVKDDENDDGATVVNGRKQHIPLTSESFIDFESSDRFPKSTGTRDNY